MKLINQSECLKEHYYQGTFVSVERPHLGQVLNASDQSFAPSQGADVPLYVQLVSLEDASPVDGMSDPAREKASQHFSHSSPWSAAPSKRAQLTLPAI